MSFTRLAGLNLLLRNRLPLLGGWLRRWAIRALTRTGSPEAARLLAQAVADSRDSQVTSLALTSLRQLTAPASIDSICQVWASTRQPNLADLLVTQGWIATKPLGLKVLTSLHGGRLEALTIGRAEVVAPLVQIAADSDPHLAGRACQVLRQLRHESAQEALCRLVIEQEQPLAREAALAAGYAPKDQTQRALFFFLTEQWSRYDSLDFDRRLLRVVYQSAPPPLRQRLLEQMRGAGRTEFLPIITGKDYRDRLDEMQAGELDLLLHTLAANQEWPELWALAFEAPFLWSGQIIKTLAGQPWRPPALEDQPIFEGLAALAESDWPANETELAHLFPPALLQAEARVPGRINDVAFAPSHPVVAIGTGQGKVVVWNFQRAEREHLLGQFDHSIGSVVYNPHNILFCGERTNGGGSCAVYSWDAHNLCRLGQHTDSVTALAPVDETHLLSAGRDHRVKLWDISGQRQVRQQQFGFWARMLRLSPDGQEAALLHQDLGLLRLPELRLSEHVAGIAGVARCAAYAPDGATLLVGQYNGEVILFRRTGPGPFKRRRDPLARRYDRVVGLEVLPQRAVIVSAGSEGHIDFTRLSDHRDAGRVQVTDGQVTSLHISADESFMAVGSAQATLSLWDLRVLELPGLLTRPVGQAGPAQLSILGSLSKHPRLSSPAQRVLEFATGVLQHRFRYAIELDEAPQIMRGEFDIELE